MNPIRNVNRGFESMIPKKIEKEEPKSYYDQGIEFTLLGKKFSFKINITSEED